MHRACPPGHCQNHNPNYHYDYSPPELQSPDVRRYRQISTFPGVTPSRQQRSRETTAALLPARVPKCCVDLSLASLSIEALCAEVGATVGAFYSRFESKEAYFNTLLELAARDG